MRVSSLKVELSLNSTQVFCIES